MFSKTPHAKVSSPEQSQSLNGVTITGGAIQIGQAGETLQQTQVTDQQTDQQVILDDRVLLPLLDGLDELGQRQAKCIDKLNEFAQSYPHVVVCCRTEEYRYLSAGKKLSALRGAVCLDPLTNGQIEAYLEALQVEELWAAVQSSPNMQHMLEPDAEGKPGIFRVPLLLSMAAVAYGGGPFVDRSALYRAYYRSAVGTRYTAG